jgi:hypothetical protein
MNAPPPRPPPRRPHVRPLRAVRGLPCRSTRPRARPLSPGAAAGVPAAQHLRIHSGGLTRDGGKVTIQPVCGCALLRPRPHATLHPGHARVLRASAALWPRWWRRRGPGQLSHRHARERHASRARPSEAGTERLPPYCPHARAYACMGATPVATAGLPPEGWSGGGRAPCRIAPRAITTDTVKMRSPPAACGPAPEEACAPPMELLPA